MLESIERKITDLKTLKSTLARWRFKSFRIVFTNGCFDLIHYGHIHYLSNARELGDKLIVGINSDASVSRLKGTHRPIKDLRSRTSLLASFTFVDRVVVFEEDTPFELIKFVQPDVLVKGGDWNPEDIVGSDLILSKGGKVESLEFVEGYSTSHFEQKIKNSLE